MYKIVSIPVVRIAGAGLAGLTMGYALLSCGRAVEIIEKNPIEKQCGDPGRSYAIQLGPKGIEALKTLGLWEGIKAHVRYMEGQKIHINSGPEQFVEVEAPYTPNHDHVYCHIERSFLIAHLTEKVRSLGGVIRYGESIHDVEIPKGSVLIGADGTHSDVRAQISKDLQPGEPLVKPNIVMSYFVIRSLAMGEYDPHWAHLWVLPNAPTIVGLPNPDPCELNLVLLGPEPFLQRWSQPDKQRELLERIKLSSHQTDVSDKTEKIRHIYALKHDLVSSEKEERHKILVGDSLMVTPPWMGIAYNMAAVEAAELMNGLNKGEEFPAGFVAYLHKNHTEFNNVVDFAVALTDYMMKGSEKPLEGQVKCFFYKTKEGPFSSRFFEPNLRINALGSEGIPAREQFEAQTHILQTIAKFLENYHDFKTLENPVEFDRIMQSLFVTNNANLSQSARSELNVIHEDILKNLPVIKFIV